MQNYLDLLVKNGKEIASKGKVAGYIPALKKMNSNYVGISVIDSNKNIFCSGNTNIDFTIQSISKTVSLLIALEDRGFDYVFSKVGMEPTGDAFNSLKKLETVQPTKPFNPMINAGAIAVTSMIKGDSSDEKFERLLNLFRRIIGDDSISYNKNVYLSEKETGNRNRSMAYFMKDAGVIDTEVEESLDVYFKQCSIEMNCLQLAKLAYFFSNNGTNYEGQKIVSDKNCEIVKTFMITCGMYNESGEYAIEVGVPSKSGVGGGIIASSSKKISIATFGPSLNSKGNSIAGIKMLKMFSEKNNLSIFR